MGKVLKSLERAAGPLTLGERKLWWFYTRAVSDLECTRVTDGDSGGGAGEQTGHITRGNTRATQGDGSREVQWLVAGELPVTQLYGERTGCVPNLSSGVTTSE